jgi:hypothetical protein
VTTPGEHESIVLKKPNQLVGKGVAGNVSKYSDISSLEIDPRAQMIKAK